MKPDRSKAPTFSPPGQALLKHELGAVARKGMKAGMGAHPFTHPFQSLEESLPRVTAHRGRADNIGVWLTAAQQRTWQNDHKSRRY